VNAVWAYVRETGIAQTGYVLDGFPVTVNQARQMEKLKISPYTVLFLNVSLEEAIRRVKREKQRARVDIFGPVNKPQQKVLEIRRTYIVKSQKKDEESALELPETYSPEDPSPIYTLQGKGNPPVDEMPLFEETVVENRYRTHLIHRRGLAHFYQTSRWQPSAELNMVFIGGKEEVKKGVIATDVLEAPPAPSIWSQLTDSLTVVRKSMSRLRRFVSGVILHRPTRIRGVSILPEFLSTRRSELMHYCPVALCDFGTLENCESASVGARYGIYYNGKIYYCCTKRNAVLFMENPT
jgi:hypothetical protein